MRPQSDLDVREQWQAASQRERANFFEFIIEDAILATCKAGDTAIDVGANYGAHSYTMLNRVGERGLVFAFEPNPVVFEALSALRRRHQQFRPMCVALSNRQGTAELIVPKDLGYGSLTALSDGEMQRVFKVEIDCLDSIPEGRKEPAPLAYQGRRRRRGDTFSARSTEDNLKGVARS